MSRRFLEKSLLCIVIGLMAITVPLGAQETRGRVNVTVLDAQAGVVQGASLELVDLATNEVRNATTTTAGTYSFSSLPVGKFRLTVANKGFRNTIYDEVTVSAAKVTDIVTTLQVGAPTETVTVLAVAPIVESTSVAIATTIDMKHIDTLPLSGRDIGQLSRIVPGYTGTWNGLPTSAQGNNIDGVISSTSRMKFGGNSSPSVSVRLENIEEMTVQTDQMDMNQGFGMATMQSTYTTKRGTNDWHGQAYWDHRNDNLNANGWNNNRRGITRAEYKLNDFGANIGGPVFRDKLFFFFSLSTSRQPGQSQAGASVLTPSAQAGNFSYLVGTQTRTVNLFQIAKAYDPSLQGTTNSVIASQMARINQAIAGSTITPSTSDPNVNGVAWLRPDPRSSWFPTFRVDYTPHSKWRISLAANQTKNNRLTSGSPPYPGDEFLPMTSGSKSNNVTTSLGVDWTATNTLLNSFRMGYLYPAGWNPWTEGDWSSHPESVYWPYAGTSPDNWTYPISTFYPVWTLADTINWQKGRHTLSFGFSAYREQDKYWNTPEATEISMGVDDGDPAYNALTNSGSYQPLPGANTSQMGDARDLYAQLTGRITYIQGMLKYDKATGKYDPQRLQHFDLNELAKAGGFFIQDGFRFRPNLTINAGFRWDFTAASVDLNGMYHNADLTSIYGPTAVANLFKPGELNGNLNPTIDERPQPYNSWYVSPQPSLGIAWSPKFGDSFLSRILGDGNTVIRSSFSLRNYTVPYQYFWNNATDYGAFYYQFYTATARNSTAPGSFAPGSLFVGSPYPTFAYAPETYEKSIPAARFTFNNAQMTNGINGMDYNLSQPYTMSWTFNIQQKLGESRALEVRYTGNRTVHGWLSLNINEVNTLENGFLDEFKNAQQNLAINAANGSGNSFANLNPSKGTVPVPIMTAAFTGSRTGAQTSAEFKRSSFITNLNTGAAGSMASTLTGLGAVPYFCNLVGAAFGPCAAQGYTMQGGGYPINFFQANPYASGIPATVMSDPGYSTYHALQVDFRQRFWHGLQFNANYTWSKNLAVGSGTDWTGAYSAVTLRDLRLSYGPTGYDMRHVANISGTVDLPFGNGRTFLNQKGPLDKVLGGWTVGTILTMRSGGMGRITGGYRTFNNLADGGVILTGVTREEIQDAIGVYKTGDPYVTLIDPKFRSGNLANPAYFKPNTTPGTIEAPFIIYGPGSWDLDMSLNKEARVTERTRLSFQAQFLNAFNHPTFRGTPGGVNSSGWGTTTSGGSSRVIEFRLRLSF